MKTKLEIHTSDSITAAKEIGTNLLREIETKFGSSSKSSLTITCQSEAGNLTGGVRGQVQWGWLWITHVWVDSESRGQGLAGQMLTAAIDWATNQGVAGIYVDTFEENVAQLYRKHGFSESGRIPNFPAGHVGRIFLYRNLR